MIYNYDSARRRAFCYYKHNLCFLDAETRVDGFRQAMVWLKSVIDI